MTSPDATYTSIAFLYKIRIVITTIDVRLTDGSLFKMVIFLERPLGII
jgi:hypothetical protein